MGLDNGADIAGNRGTDGVNSRIDNSNVGSSGIDAIIAAVLRRWLLVLAFALAFGLAFAALTYIMTPIYRGTSILAPADLEKNGMSSGLSSALGSVSGFAALAGIGLGGNDYATEEAMAVLKSEQFTRIFIQENDLLPKLFPKLWDAGAGHWKTGIKKVPTLGRGFKAFNGIRKLQRDNKTGLITVQIDWKDPVTAANWTNQLVDRLNDEMRRRALSQAEASMGYLQHELADTIDVTTREAISHLMEGQIKQEMLAHVTKQYALRVVDTAIPADIDSPVRPIKILYLAFGLFFGAMVGTFVARSLDKRAAAVGK
jgi:uncharacterized protein involved in exopolysaccharide biosynthesis